MLSSQDPGINRDFAGFVLLLDLQSRVYGFAGHGSFPEQILHARRSKFLLYKEIKCDVLCRLKKIFSLGLPR
jgi:hypothetical protein